MEDDRKFLQGEATGDKEAKTAQLSCTFVENMREQPKATGLIYSPRRPGKSSENDGRSGSKVKSSKSSAKSSDTSTSSINFFDAAPKRKSLQILQPSADGQKLTGRSSALKSKSKKKVRESSAQSRSRQTKLCVTRIDEETDSPSASGPERESSSDEAYSLMVEEHAPEKYWELVAEERRKALEETLEENMKLYQMIEELKAENRALHEKTNDTDYFATMYKIAQSSDVIKPAEENQSN